MNARRIPLLAWVVVSAIAVTGSSSSGVAHAAEVGDHTRSMHDLDNDVFGPILGDVAIDDLDVSAESAAMSVAMTVMVDDGTDTCGTDTAAVVEKGTALRFCYTMTNTGDEALNLHDVRDSHIGQIVGPGYDHLVQPGDGVVLTATGNALQKSALHDVVWEATGVESDTVVYDWDGVFVTVLGPEITLDMTVMVDDGHGTCGTESELAVPAGTNVTYCYTMTDSGDEDVNYHFLHDDQLGLLINHLDREIAPGETLVHTEVALITEAVTSTAQWAALSQGTGVDVLDSDSVVVEIVDEVDPTTTTTTTVAGSGPCAPEPPGPTTPDPPATATTMPATTSTSTTTTIPVTTTTQPPSLTTTTTGLGIVLPTTSTAPGAPAGFASRRPAAPCQEPPPSNGAFLPATGSRSATQIVLAFAIIVVGWLAMITARWRRP